jgi:Insertion element 4 transposase N-terminal
MSDNGVVAGGRLTDQITLGVLASAVPRDAVDDAVDSAGRQARRRDGKLPPHVMVYFTMAMALFADDDYEEIAARLAGTLASWGCWDDSWSVPTSGGITQARQRLGSEPLAGLFAAAATPASSSAPGTTPTGSRNPATTASGTRGRRRSCWSTCPQLHDQLWLGSIGSSARRPSSRGRRLPGPVALPLAQKNAHHEE